MDIEGAEPDALLGARATIARHRPILAMCAYHEQDHLWSIPLSLRETCDNYSFVLRPHNEEGWDLVCYGVPHERLRSRSGERNDEFAQLRSSVPDLWRYAANAASSVSSSPRSRPSDREGIRPGHVRDVWRRDSPTTSRIRRRSTATTANLRNTSITSETAPNPTSTDAGSPSSPTSRAVHPRQDARILDVGCATGKLLALLRDKGFPQVTVSILRPLRGGGRTAVRHSRAHDNPVASPRSGETFDVVILVGVLEHIHDLDTACGRCTTSCRRRASCTSKCRTPTPSRTGRTRHSGLQHGAHQLLRAGVPGKSDARHGFVSSSPSRTRASRATARRCRTCRRCFRKGRAPRNVRSFRHGAPDSSVHRVVSRHRRNAAPHIADLADEPASRSSCGELARTPDV